MKRQVYEKRLSHIKKEYKGKDSIKKALIVMLDAQYEYYNAHVTVIEKPISGLTVGKLDPGLAQLAKQEAIACCREMAFNADNYANIRFYINTPYFSRTGNDKFSCYGINDTKVQNLVKVVRYIKTQNTKNNDDEESMINIVVRCYWDNHTLSFHSDRKEFGEHIYGAVIHNAQPEQGLILKNKALGTMLDESQPMWWHLTGESRWDYQHGYCAAIKQPDYDSEPVRISVSFRYYQDSKWIPKPGSYR